MNRVKHKSAIFIVLVICVSILVSFALYRGVLKIPVVSDYIVSIQEESEEYEIFSVYLNASIDNDGEKIEKIYISKNGKFLKNNMFTGHNNSPIFREEELKNIEKQCELLYKYETRKNACIKNSKPLNLERKFNIKKEYILIDESELKKDEDGSTRKAIIEKYPDIRGVFRFSRIGFNKNRTEALFYVEFDCLAWCSSGQEYFLEKKNGKWQYKGTDRFWVE